MTDFLRKAQNLFPSKKIHYKKPVDTWLKALSDEELHELTEMADFFRDELETLDSPEGVITSTIASLAIFFWFLEMGEDKIADSPQGVIKRMLIMAILPAFEELHRQGLLQVISHYSINSDEIKFKIPSQGPEVKTIKGVEGLLELLGE